MAEQPQGFWSTLPGILTGVAAVITAATGLYIAITNNNQPDAQSTDTGNNSVSSQDSTTSGETKPSQTGKTSVINSAGMANTTTVIQVKNLKPFPKTGPLVDCSLFPTVNSVSSLMSWSNYYHKQIITANGIKARAKDPCNKTIDYRGMAHCKDVNNAQIRQSLLETLHMCRQVGIEWRDIQHSSITAQ